MSSLKKIGFIFILGSLVVSCSNDQGKLVDKSPSTSTPAPSQAIAQTMPQEMPAGHPPIGDTGMGGMGGGMGSMGMGGMSPAPEPIIVGDTVKAAMLQFTIDTSWVSEKPQSAMRAAQFRLPAPDGVDGDGELAIFQGIGGTADANIQRWILQVGDRVGEPIITKKQVGPFAIQMVDVSGTFGASTMMGGNAESKPGYRMLAAVVEGAGGPWHFKLTGPQKTLEQWKPKFEAMIDSLKPLE